MTDTQMLVGSLSNDLFRVASLPQMLPLNNRLATKEEILDARLYLERIL